MIATINPDFPSHLSYLIFGVCNIGLAINEVIMHSFFVYYILSVSMMKRDKKKSHKLKIRATILALNSILLISGGVVNLFNNEVGTAIIYTSWIWGVWVFLVINKTVAKGMKDNSATNSNVTTTRLSQPNISD